MKRITKSLEGLLSSLKLSILLNKSASNNVADPELIYAIAKTPAAYVEIDVLKLIEETAKNSDKFAAEDHSLLTFAKAAIFHDRGRHDEAWQTLIDANEAYNKQFEHIFPEDMKIDEEILQTIRDHNDLNLAIGTKPNETPMSLFILGPSRSGKTTTEFLASHLPQVKRGYENVILTNVVRDTLTQAGLPIGETLTDVPPELDDQVIAHYLDRLKDQAGGARIFTDTSPPNIRSVHRIANILPNVRFIFVKRNFDDVALRMLMTQYRKGNSYAYNIDNIRKYINWYYEMINVLIAKFPDICTLIQYEEMIEDSGGALNEIARLCGIDATDSEVPSLGDDRNCSKPYRNYMAGELNT